ncbi:MAG: TonB-dependent receptor [Marinilabiliales bacterium]|nr:MAG: TonB-dependent receptor [Marinilabiliales bacterium]
MTMAQGTVSGTVYDDSYGESLIGSSIVVQGTTTGTTTDINGYFSLKLDAGSYTLEVSYLGYETKTFEATVNDGEVTRLGRIKLKATSTLLKGVDIIADRAKDRETPVAVSNVTKAEIEETLGSQDIPLIMNNTPSVYSTQQGGGAGDARINVRGFNQNNIAIMINGVPINDMENGWVYWSNWDGLADATSSIQMQRGLSAVNLATPGIGGTMNIITSPAEMEAGASARFEYGSGNFMKTTLSGHTGLIKDKFAMSVSVVKKVGEGLIDKTWTDAYAYYLGASYNINKKHRLEAYVMGAPQRHGQNLYKQNVAAYSHDYAKEIGADSAAANIMESPRGRLYNENWNTVRDSYNGQQAWNQRDPRDRYNSGFINERENYFHKPVANLNWYAQWNEKLSQFTTVYYSGGKGGGTGTYGKIQYDYASEPTRIPDWNATIDSNLSTTYTREGILRNSVNNQWTVGVISRVKAQVSDNFKMQVGIDWRTAKIDHFREVRDLLGLQSFYYDGNDFDTEADYNKGLGDKIAYNNTNTVDWGGAFVQGEYTNGVWSAYGTFGYSMVKYSYTDHFTKDATTGNALFTEAEWIGGVQVKGGLNYNLSETFNVYANAGYVTKVPIFDQVIDDGDGSLRPDPANEKFTSYEIGAAFRSLNGKIRLDGNFYYTTWLNRAFSRGIGTTGDSTAFLNVDQRHIGFEFTGDYRIIQQVGVGIFGSIANWTYLNDATIEIKDGDNNVVGNNDTKLDQLHVGDAPQTQLGISLNVYPVNGLSLQFIARYNANHYAAFNPQRLVDDPNDTQEVWKTPAYTVMDLHVNYKLPLKGRVGVTIFGHVFNLLDEIYVQDAVDNSSYNGYYGYDGALTHTANSAEVFLGLPRTFNVGARISFN